MNSGRGALSADIANQVRHASKRAGESWKQMADAKTKAIVLPPRVTKAPQGARATQVVLAQGPRRGLDLPIPMPVAPHRSTLAEREARSLQTHVNAAKTRHDKETYQKKKLQRMKTKQKRLHQKQGITKRTSEHKQREWALGRSTEPKPTTEEEIAAERAAVREKAAAAFAAQKKAEADRNVRRKVASGIPAFLAVGGSSSATNIAKNPLNVFHPRKKAEARKIPLFLAVPANRGKRGE